MAEYLTTDTELTSIADAIRAKGGTSASLEYPDEFVSAIEDLETGTDTSDATMTSGNQMLSGVTAYSQGTKYTGTIASKSTSDMTVSGATVTAPAGYYSSNSSKSVASGSATAPATISGTSATLTTGTNTVTLSKSIGVTPTVSAGYVSSGTEGTSAVSLTASVTTKAAATYTPTTTAQTIAAGTYLTGAQTISGDANLVAGNIANGVTIFNITGTHQGGTDTSDATMTSGGQMLAGVTAYSQGTKYTGTIVSNPDSGTTTLDSSNPSKSFPAGYYASAHGCDVPVYDGSVS